ncbi:hypothetical protein [Acinetobacter pittii]|uniref:Uncharacterized protein n=1 Tax=Acinetobacter pittii TaxID=48296 RepID=A0A6H0FSH1_ACIPI|nr:hypothetical protein [Acinetobacter pittii]QIT17303.1 hypothetical protein G8E09_06010 [Acinetobacter pittii]
MFSLEPKKEKTFWKEMDFYKEHWSIIIFIPALLGGLIQILKLYSIDPSFVRFFAVEQVIPDGLFISFIIFIGIMCYLFFHKYYKFELKIKYGWSFKNVIKNISNRLAIFLILSFLIIYIYLIEPVFNESTPLLFFIIQLVFEIIAVYHLIEIFFIIIIIFILRNSKDKTNPTKTEKKQAVDIFLKKLNVNLLILFILFPITILLAFYFLYKISILYTKVNTLPPTINENIFLAKTKTALKIKDELNIEYYNGKYIFLKVTNVKNKENFLILKGESFVNLIDKDEK